MEMQFLIKTLKLYVFMTGSNPSSRAVSQWICKLAIVGSNPAAGDTFFFFAWAIQAVCLADIN